MINRIKCLSKPKAFFRRHEGGMLGSKVGITQNKFGFRSIYAGLYSTEAEQTHVEIDFPRLKAFKSYGIIVN